MIFTHTLDSTEIIEKPHTMRTILKRGLSILILLETKPTAMEAQSPYSRYEIGLSAGTFLYQGDLTPAAQGSARSMNTGFTVMGSRLLTPSLSARVNLAVGRLSGDDGLYKTPDWRQQRNFTFQTPLLEFSAQAVWDPTAQNFTRSRIRFSPYVFAGVGVSFLRINRDWSGFNSSYFESEPEIAAGLEVDAARKLPGMIPVIPLGAGIKYHFNDRFSFQFESNYRLTYTDYLDGFSQSANPQKADHYHSQSVGLVYRFGKRPSWKCPKIPL